jgi:hypothetical protein
MRATTDCATVQSGFTPRHAAETRRLRCFRLSAQHFGDAPRLPDAAAGPVRRARVKDVAACADAGFVQMMWKALEVCAQSNDHVGALSTRHR